MLSLVPKNVYECRFIYWDAQHERDNNTKSVVDEMLKRRQVDMKPIFGIKKQKCQMAYTIEIEALESPFQTL